MYLEQDEMFHLLVFCHFLSLKTWSVVNNSVSLQYLKTENLVSYA